VLGGLSVPRDPRVLVDYRTADDAGVYKWDETRALVQTVDFFTPIVDDPFVFGQIAAANSLSDVYAMGGRPLTALAVAGFPKDLARSVLASIFTGGLDVLQRAGVALLGGHTVQDQEIKFGYAVTGEVAPDRIWTNAGARPGDVLFLTKAIGTGIITTALKSDRAPEAAVTEAVRSMLTLNRDATEALRSLTADAIHACTDITGFGLIGHASEMAVASDVTIELDPHAVPLLDQVLTLVDGNIPGGGRTNAQHFGPNVRLEADANADLLAVLYDPQTSGGLLISVAQPFADVVESTLTTSAVPAHRVGRVTASAGCRVLLR
jgi:selenide, water dikinase